MQTMQVEVWVVVSEGEDYAVGVDEESAAEAFESNVANLTDAGSTRRIRVTLTVPVPKPVELTGTVPEESREGWIDTEPVLGRDQPHPQGWKGGDFDVEPAKS